MSTVIVRQSGGANIVSIPKAIVQTLNLQVGSKLELSIIDNKIVLTPVDENLSLEVLLADSPKESFIMTEDDKEWMDANALVRR
ncbi:AbrB/MazE/SpoVT family DNA-binding domain-containing protein [Vibrio sinensis]|uniref:AbrB/MazE/SpoVT family DNA-binding domain-containing protein n=1 Tax=Vibrio sinensis TaxID=2302434 RepID=A0A3A6QLE6_9VIBR|nr:AbrB/MazE/SpoVT family DNA-binding domain-containing protein [Vibrio sinensis]RJX68618.1 AbrB/MazE/SpoVT family DNA-binding domain-containing protein [Vibrio sinensis]